MENLTHSAAEEIDARDKQMETVTDQLSAFKEVSYEYEVRALVGGSA